MCDRFWSAPSSIRLLVVLASSMMMMMRCGASSSCCGWELGLDAFVQSSRDEVVVVVYGHVAAASVVVADEIASTTLVLGDTILDRLSFHRRRTSDNPSWL